MVIAVKDLEDGAVLAEALADAMKGKEQLPSPASYSAFELARIR
jgi:2-polyprenyl-6-methoxyphenol hydroxylase-like FAD-dependent oxidoreductase